MFHILFTNFSHIERAHIFSKSKRCFNVKSPTYCFHMKTEILADFQICISVPLRNPSLKNPEIKTSGSFY